MNRWLLDASVLLASEDPDDANHAQASQLLTGADPLATLDLAYYELANVAVRAWHDVRAARRLSERVSALADDGGMVRADASLVALAARVAEEQGLSVYDAAYVAAARTSNSRLVSCDVRDLVSKRLACLPGDALSGLPGSGSGSG